MHRDRAPATMQPLLQVHDPLSEPDPVLIDQLVALLVLCITQGASMTFHPPLDTAQLARYWTATLKDPKRTTIICRDANAPRAHNLLGTVTLHDIGTDTGPFRAKVEKLMVAPTARELGVGRRLMARLEREGLARGLYYLTFGTETGCPAESFYKRLGYRVEGVLPDYIRTPDGRLVGNTHFYKQVTKANLLDEGVSSRVNGAMGVASVVANGRSNGVHA